MQCILTQTAFALIEEYTSQKSDNLGPDLPGAIQWRQIVDAYYGGTKRSGVVFLSGNGNWKELRAPSGALN